jgi:V/A-type H+/Na+-transporting ATPase subunit E
MAQTTSGIAELIGRLRKDGVDAGEAEKGRILTAAQQQADAIIAAAKQTAEDLLGGAKQERERLKQQLDAELAMAARDFVMRFSERIRAQVVRPVVHESVRGALSDPGFLQGALKELVVRYAEGGAVEVAIAPELREQLEGFFTGELARSLAGGKAQLVDEQGLVGFRIVKQGESFAWDFSEDAVAKELVRLVDPALKTYFALEAGAKKRSNGEAQHAKATSA